MSLLPPAPDLQHLKSALQGDFHTDEAMRRIYATDASSYEEWPLAVAIPESEEDLGTLIAFAGREKIGLIPRTAGTSLAGQVVGNGIVLDLSRHFTRILEINADEGWVRCQPGVIRNELNMALQPQGLLFGPETSTQNRAMMGGMLGNNSCGSNSIRYGSVRDQVIEVTALLSDGSKAVFGSLDREAFAARCAGPDCLETRLYQHIAGLLGDPARRQSIREGFPDPSITRRNTGYALDLLMDAACFDAESDKPFNFARLIAGSEGTLCLVTEMKLRCNPLPPPVDGLLCAQFASIDEALRATRICVRYDCFAVELIDHYILECTERSLEHRENRFFLEGSPAAVLVTEIRGGSEEAVRRVTDEITAEMKAAGLGYAYPVLFGADTVKIWNLRKAGLGLLSNMPGDAKPVPVVEDTAVRVEDLPDYIREFNRRLQERFGIQCVHYAHAGSGEIHMRPIINLKTSEGNRTFREVARTIVELVREYRGSLSGEHGDGRLRGEFLEEMIGSRNYGFVVAVKRCWDPDGIFNPNKIVDTPPMNSHLRFVPGQRTEEPATFFDWSSTGGMLGAAEMCNGSGDCRKTHLAGGTMCPSYMATRHEKDTTRARANMLRQALTEGAGEARRSVFDNPGVKEILDLCLSCKGCKKECPSTVDMARLKAEFTQHYLDANGIPLRTRMIAGYARSQALASRLPGAWNILFGSVPLRRVLNRLVGFHPDRSIPLLPKKTLASWFRSHVPHKNAGSVGSVCFFNDEFTNYNDAEIGIKAVELLERLGYAVELPEVSESGRTWLSKGLVRKARKPINANVRLLGARISAERPLVGAEPSGILTFVDEAPDLVDPALREAARAMAPHCYMVEAFIAREAAAGRISSDAFTTECRRLKLHAHCFQKALHGPRGSIDALSLPRNYTVELIPSGCCGMAGSFGYESEHYGLSMQVGELVLFPAVREAGESTLIAAPGTSCRHQIHDGTGRSSLHPVEILHQALV